MISSPQNETIRTLRRLRRDPGEHAILEGPHLLRDALAAGIPIETVLATARFDESRSGRQLLESSPVPVSLVADAILDKLSDADAPRGVLALARLPRLTISEVRFERDSIWLYLDTIQDPGNVGALARIAEGLGASGLLLSPGCADTHHPRALRASAGSLLRMPAVGDVTAADASDWSEGAQWIGLEAHAGSESLRNFRVARPFVVAIGAEGPGLSAETRARLHRSLTIPLRGRLESLNVAVAAALVLEALERQG